TVHLGAPLPVMVRNQPRGGPPTASASKLAVFASDSDAMVAPKSCAAAISPAGRSFVMISPRCLGIADPLQGLSEVDGFALTPVVQEQVARLLVGHVLVDGDNGNAFRAHGAQHRLELVLQHGNISVDHGGIIHAQKTPTC